jgi:alanine racemase
MQQMSHITTENTAVEQNPSALDYTLSALDRCDSCGAQAYVRATLASGDLLFCAHHGTKFKDKLFPTALNWHDESARLLQSVSE